MKAGGVSNLLITGCAGFIGYHLAKACLECGIKVIGVDNLNDYYDVNLKQARLKLLLALPNFTFYTADITDLEGLHDIFSSHTVDKVVHLAAQPGVRFSLKNPHAYVQTNVVGFTNVIDVSRLHGVKSFIYASSSSVYGANQQEQYHERMVTDSPLNIYAATKKANELISYSYSNLYGINTTGLRFFTAYGPWGRPDMAFFLFTRNILAGREIIIHNKGRLYRDFTYIDDIISAILLVLEHHSIEKQGLSKVYNIGRGHAVGLLDYIYELERAIGKEAIKIFGPMQPGEMISTHACMQDFHQTFDYIPETSIRDGIKYFVDWYMDYYMDS